MSADTFNEIKTRLESVVSSIQDIEYDLFENDFSDEEKEEIEQVRPTNSNDLKTKFLLAAMYTPTPVLLKDINPTDAYRLNQILDDGFMVTIRNANAFDPNSGKQYEKKYFYSDYGYTWEFE